MTTGMPRPRARLSSTGSYNAAVQFYNQEFRTLGERTTAFLIVQSILVAAFVTVLVNLNWFPYAFEPIALGVSVVGILYCTSHYLGGRSGSQAAFRWRQYMLNIENNQRNAPWRSAYDLTPHTHGRARLRNLLTRLLCERCLLERPPLPTTWLISPATFLIVWVCAILYIMWRHFLPTCSIAILAVLSAIILVATFTLITYFWVALWWHTRNQV